MADDHNGAGILELTRNGKMRSDVEYGDDRNLRVATSGSPE